MFKFLGFLFTAFIFASLSSYANTNVCSSSDRACIVQQLISETEKIGNVSWRDQSYREIAKTLAADGKFKEAVELWEKIETPDTKAMTIRGIGMAAADFSLNKGDLNSLFASLREKAETIDHPPSYAIALTYIAMSQAFAGDDAGAWATSASMENDALRHKAYGETAEIQAEMGNFDGAMKSIGFIESTAYRNKSYALVSKIFADRENYDAALKAAVPLTNSYKKAKAMQYVLDKQKIPLKGEP